MIFTAVGQLIQRDALPRQPLAVRALGCDDGFEFLVRNQTPFLEIQQEHFAWLQPPFELDVSRVNMNYTDLGCHDDFVVMGHVVTTWAQAIAIQNGANVVAIGKYNRRRAIPRFNQGGVELIKRFFIGRHIDV